MKYALEPADHGLYRVVAARTIKTRFGTILQGQRGGLVEGPDNLSQIGECWIDEGASATGKATVSGAARIGGMASVQGQASVTDSAYVGGNAAIAGKARVAGYASVTGNAVVMNRAVVTDSATVTDSAMIMDNATISGRAVISGSVRVLNSATVTDHATASDQARINSTTRVGGTASVGGTAVLTLDTCMTGGSIAAGTLHGGEVHRQSDVTVLHLDGDTITACRKASGKPSLYSEKCGAIEASTTLLKALV